MLENQFNFSKSWISNMESQEPIHCLFSKIIKCRYAKLSIQTIQKFFKIFALKFLHKILSLSLLTNTISPAMDFGPQYILMWSWLGQSWSKVYWLWIKASGRELSLVWANKAIQMCVRGTEFKGGNLASQGPRLVLETKEARESRWIG